jgi:hybrid polyketide synthase/nonribosomal peptide synthetase ACE1
MAGHDFKGREPIAVVGYSCRFPGPASNASKLWDLLVSPSDISKEIPLDRFNLDAFYHPDANHHGTFNTRRSYFVEEDIRNFDASFFHIHPREAETMDPQQRILLETVFESMESAGYTLDGMQGSQTSVFVGGMSYDFRDSLYIRDPASIPEYAATGAHASILAARISYFFDWHGPCMSIDTACSSSLVAVHQAVQTLRNGEATTAVAAGSNLILEPEQYIALSNLAHR